MSSWDVRWGVGPVPLPPTMESTAPMSPADVGQAVLRQLAAAEDLITSSGSAGRSEIAASRVGPTVPAPPAPGSMGEAEISLGQLAALILKLLYLHGTRNGYEITQDLRLPFSVTVEALDFLKSERCIEVLSGELVGRLSYRFLLTDTGRTRAREAFDECRYVGPAPVSLAAYTRQCRLQGVQHVTLNTLQLREALGDLVLSDELIQQLGPALCSGRSLFLHGAPGNGKSVIAHRLGRALHLWGGDIYVPYAVSVDNQVLTVFDPAIHISVQTEVPEADESELTWSGHSVDHRWRRVRRPVVMAGGELTLQQLDLVYHADSRYYTAPLQIKSNGGIFLLDDFGRQQATPRELLNRWILPLEERTDYLVLATGKKFAVPFEQLVIFSTNLNPSEFVDPAFLRRIRHKISVSAPTRNDYHQVFRKCCEQQNLPYDAALIDGLITDSYGDSVPLRASDPRDLLEVVQSICRFKNQRPQLTQEVLREAFQQCLGGPHLLCRTDSGGFP